MWKRIPRLVGAIEKADIRLQGIWLSDDEKLPGGLTIERVTQTNFQNAFELMDQDSVCIVGEVGADDGAWPPRARLTRKNPGQRRGIFDIPLIGFEVVNDAPLGK